jgi:hypothetical protein
MIFVIFMVVSSVMVLDVRGAEAGLNLPSTPVFIGVINGTDSYFITMLSAVSSGFDVANGSYAGWCVDVRASMSRIPVIHEVELFSSTDPPSDLVNESWSMLNYVLNHKQGNVQDVQQAIWYFICMGGNYTPTSSLAWVMINDSLANGKGFSPVPGQIVALICYPLLYSHQQDVQISIFEIIYPVKTIAEVQMLLILPMLILLFFPAVVVYKRKHRGNMQCVECRARAIRRCS